MRTASIVAALALAGCSSNWKAYGIDTSCVEVPFFPDADGDGWGDASVAVEAAELVCEGQEGANLVRNNRDCDDEDAAVTGRTGSLCPDQLVAQDPVADTEFTPITSGSEFVLVHPDTPLVWPGAAEQACGPFGWGGGLATFRDRGQLETVLGALGSGAIDYAGWVGFHPTLKQWGAYDDEGAWVQDTDGGTFAVTLCNCRGDADPETCDDVYTDDLGYLALVRDGAATSWCLGTPDEAGVSDPAYETLYGHFVCERPIPEPADWALAPPEEG